MPEFGPGGGDLGQRRDVAVGRFVVLQPDRGLAGGLVEVGPRRLRDERQRGIHQAQHLFMRMHRPGPLDGSMQCLHHLFFQGRIRGSFPGRQEVGGGDGCQLGVVQIAEVAGGEKMEIPAVGPGDPTVGHLAQHALHPPILTLLGREWIADEFEDLAAHQVGQSPFQLVEGLVS